MITVFRATLHPERDSELRLAFLTLLTRLLSDKRQPLNANGAINKHSISLIVDILVPNLVWYGGRVSGGIIFLYL